MKLAWYFMTYLEDALAAGVVFHDLHRPVHETLVTWHRHALVLQPTHAILVRVITTRRTT